MFEGPKPNPFNTFKIPISVNGVEMTKSFELPLLHFRRLKERPKQRIIRLLANIIVVLLPRTEGAFRRIFVIFLLKAIKAFPIFL